VKTTIEIPDELFRQAKAQAALEGIRLRDLVVRGLQMALDPPATGRSRRIELPILKSGSPGVLNAAQVTAALEQLDEDEAAELARHMRR
jgi:hypothetical protein